MRIEGRGESGKGTYIGCNPENSRMACEHGSRQALPGLSVVFEQMGEGDVLFKHSDFIISRHHDKTRIVVCTPHDCPGKLQRKGQEDSILDWEIH